MKNTIIALLLLSPLLATAIDNYSQASVDFILTRQSETGEFDNLGVFVTGPAIAALQKYSCPVQIQKGANYIASAHHPNGCISTWCYGNGHIPDESGISLWAL